MRKLILAVVIGVVSVSAHGLTSAAETTADSHAENVRAAKSLDRDKRLDRAAQRRHTRSVNKKPHRKFKKATNPVVPLKP